MRSRPAVPFSPALLISLALLAPVPPAPAQAPGGPGTGDPADGRTFRILDRFCKDVDGAVLFRGQILRSLPVNKAAAGDHSLCVNCGADAARQASQPGQGEGASAPAPAARPLGELLVLDLTKLWRTTFDGGALVFRNFDGYDADGREYVAYPAAGADTETALVGSLLLAGGRLPEKPAPEKPAAEGFQLVLRRLGSTYLAPIGGGTSPPEKLNNFGPSEQHLRAMARPRHKGEPDWPGRYPTEYLYRDGLAKNPLMESIALLAASGEDFLMVVDLRKLESKKASYFWAPLLPRPGVHLDENSLAIEGGSGGAGSYEPYTYVDYPYLVIAGPYARIRLTPTNGGPESRLVVGFCDECP